MAHFNERTGICRLCGEFKQLSFEHVPPRAAYNDVPVYHPDTRKLLAHRAGGGPHPDLITEPRGAGGYTLCGPCNSRCGRYAREFIAWAIFMREAVDSDPRATTISASYLMRRSRVMKEIVAMFLSANSPQTGEVNPGLRRFVWNAECSELPDGIRIFAGLTRNPHFSRQVGFTGVLRADGTNSMLSEIAFPPFTLIMTFGGTDPGEPRLFDITFFANAGFKERQLTQVPLSVLELRDIYPGTYRA